MVPTSAVASITCVLPLAEAGPAQSKVLVSALEIAGFMTAVAGGGQLLPGWLKLAVKRLRTAQSVVQCLLARAQKAARYALSGMGQLAKIAGVPGQAPGDAPCRFGQSRCCRGAQDDVVPQMTVGLKWLWKARGWVRDREAASCHLGVAWCVSEAGAVRLQVPAGACTADVA